MAGESDDGWETVTDPAEIQQVLGKAGANKVLGLTSGGPGSGGGKAATEGERKTAVLATRLAGGISVLNGIGKSGERPGMFQAIVRGALGDTAANYVTGDDRQRVEAAQSDILDAALTLGTGAAYTKEQLEGYRKAYFPQLGDSDATVADKRKRLGLLLESARIGAGSASPQVETALTAAGFPAGQSKGGDQQSGAAGAIAGSGGTPPTSPSGGGGGPGEVVFADQMPDKASTSNLFTPEQQKAFEALAQNGGSTQQLDALARSFGVTSDPENLKAIAAFYSDPKNAKVPLAVNRQGLDEVKAVDPGDGALGAAARGAGNALTLGFLDEAGALADTVTQGGTYGENLDRRRGMELYDQQNNAGSRFAGQVVGSLPLGGVEIAGAREAARAAGIAAVRGGAPVAEARAIANRVFATRTAAEAAGISGVYGAGDAQGGATDRLAGGAIGAATGAALGGGAALAGGRFARMLAERRAARLGQPLNDGQAALAAADRQGITPFPADVGGGLTRMATSGTAQTLGGVVPIRRAAQATLDSAEAVRNRVAATIGTAEQPEAAGEAARAGAQAFITRTGQRIGRIYDAASAAAGQARIATPEAVRVLDQELAPLAESPVQGPGVAILQGLRESLDQPQTVRGLREMRSLIRDEFESAGLRGSNIERIAGRVVDAATDDIVNGLRAQGLDRAATQYRVADRMWRERLATIDDHLEPILGGSTPKSGEQVVQALQSAMKGNNRRFAGFIQALPENEQATVRASLIQRLGRATKGNQDQDGEVFSLATFGTHWDEIGERAKETLFGAEGRAALNDLARYAAQSKQAQRFANTSNTGSAVTTSALGAAAAGPIGVLGALKVVALSYGAGRLLASPRFARWLARPPRDVSPAATQAYIARLSRIARSEPAIANDVLRLQQHLADTFGSAPARLAAQPSTNGGAGIQGQASDGQTANQRLQP